MAPVWSLWPGRSAKSDGVGKIKTVMAKMMRNPRADALDKRVARLVAQATCIGFHLSVKIPGSKENILAPCDRIFDDVRDRLLELKNKPA